MNTTLLLWFAGVIFLVIVPLLLLIAYSEERQLTEHEKQEQEADYAEFLEQMKKRRK